MLQKCTGLCKVLLQICQRGFNEILVVSMPNFILKPIIILTCVKHWHGILLFLTNRNAMGHVKARSTYPTTDPFFSYNPPVQIFRHICDISIPLYLSQPAHSAAKLGYVLSEA